MPAKKIGKKKPAAKAKNKAAVVKKKPKAVKKEVKAEVKKAVKKEAKPEAKKAAPKAEKKAVKIKGNEKPAAKAKGSKTKEIKAISKKVKAKKRYLFRGRFGSRNSVRNISDKKWQRWRKPRGIDIHFKIEDGLYPKTGYGTPNAIKNRHPSGFIDVLVKNPAELEAISGKKDVAARFASTLGKKKRKTMNEMAEKLGIVVLNG